METFLSCEIIGNLYFNLGLICIVEARIFKTSFTVGEIISEPPVMVEENSMHEPAPNRS